MKLALLGGLWCATALTIPASAQIRIYIGTPPPPLRYENPGPMPGPGYAWTEGYWQPGDDGHYRWVRGQWMQPPFAGAYWSHPHYDHYQQGWQLHQGHWDQQDNRNGHDRGQDNGRGNGGENHGNGNDGHGNHGKGNGHDH